VWLLVVVVCEFQRLPGFFPTIKHCSAFKELQEKTHPFYDANTSKSNEPKSPKRILELSFHLTGTLLCEHSLTHQWSAVSAH